MNVSVETQIIVHVCGTYLPFAFNFPLSLKVLANLIFAPVDSFFEEIKREPV